MQWFFWSINYIKVPTGENHYIFKITNDNAIVITDTNLINILLDKFKDLINQDLNYFLDKNIWSYNNVY